MTIDYGYLDITNCRASMTSKDEDIAELDKIFLEESQQIRNIRRQMRSSDEILFESKNYRSIKSITRTEQLVIRFCFIKCFI